MLDKSEKFDQMFLAHLLLLSLNFVSCIIHPKSSLIFITIEIFYFVFGIFYVTKWSIWLVFDLKVIINTTESYFLNHREVILKKPNYDIKLTQRWTVSYVQISSKYQSKVRFLCHFYPQKPREGLTAHTSTWVWPVYFKDLKQKSAIN